MSCAARLLGDQVNRSRSKGIFARNYRRLSGPYNNRWGRRQHVAASSIESEKAVAQAKEGILNEGPARSAVPEAVVFDMDGTLLRSDKRIGRKTKEAIMEASRLGVMLCLATGKARSKAMEVLEREGVLSHQGGDDHRSPPAAPRFDGPGVFLQGLKVMKNQNECAHSAVLSERIVRWSFMNDFGPDVVVTAFSGDECYALANDKHPLAVGVNNRHAEPYPRSVDSIEEIVSKGVNKLLIANEGGNQTHEPLRHYVESKICEEADVTVAVPGTLEVVPKSFSKKRGLEIMFAHAKMRTENIAAVGDGENDAPMLRYCNTGVALANANPKSVKEADMVLSTTNDEEGPAEALQKLVFDPLQCK